MSDMADALARGGITIDMFPETAEKEKKKRVNVLLLTMSTLPGHGRAETINLGVTNYTYKLRTEVQGKRGTIEFTGYSQLEPVPVSLAWRLAERGEKLDKIFVINNSDTTKEEKLIRLLDKDKIVEIPNESAYGFFANRILNYNFGDVVFKADDGDSQINDITVNISKESLINVDLENQTRGIFEICTELRKIKSESDKSEREMKLFLDIHGGLREQQIIVDSIISVLEHESIYIDEAYSVEGNPPNVTITNADESINVLKLVSGVNEFVNYGRSNTLKKYYDSTRDTNSQDIINAINGVSDSLQLCRMDEFATNVEDFKTALNNYPDNGKLVLIKNIIADDFKELFDNVDNSYYLTSQIKWCVKHEFFQQALTIIESLIPSYLLEKGVISYNIFGNGNDYGQASNMSIMGTNDFAINISCKLKGTDPAVRKYVEFKSFINTCKSKQNWKGIENYIFEECTRCFHQTNSNGPTINIASMTSVGDYREVQTVNDNSYYALLTANGKLFGDYDRSCWTSKIEINAPENHLDDFNRFVQIHWLLKEQRNNTNHAGPVNTSQSTNQVRADVEHIKVAITAYVELLEEMLP